LKQACGKRWCFQAFNGRPQVSVRSGFSQWRFLKGLLSIMIPYEYGVISARRAAYEFLS
jgi:hypothetical protein